MNMKDLLKNKGDCFTFKRSAWWTCSYSRN